MREPWGWDYDAVGNFDSVTTNGTAQARTANRQNEITSIGGATTPTYDANGNMTGDETGKQFVYDGWNRMVAVKNSGGTTLKTYSYDGLNRRVAETAGGTTTDLFYSADWQVLAEKVGANYARRYVWSPVYVDAMVLRDRDTNADGTLDERLWVQQDANWNVTALVDGSGNVVERYAYDPYGVQTVLDANWSVDTDGLSDVEFRHGYQGLLFDAVAGLNRTHSRPYSPTLARFTGPDWIGFDGGNVNLYGFVNNNPANLTDPSGLAPPSIVPLDPKSANAEAWRKIVRYKVLPHPEPKTVQDYINNNKAITAFYAEMYKADPEAFAWAGLAAYASHDIGAGMAKAGLLAQLGINLDITGTTTKDLFALLAMGNTAIFNDIAWQHMAYYAGGIEAIEANKKSITPGMLAAWRNIEKAKNIKNPEERLGLFMKAAQQLAQYEQKEVLQPIFDKYMKFLKGLTLAAIQGGSSIPGARFDFRYGRFEDFDNRWQWITETLLPTWFDYQLREPKKVSEFMGKVIAACK